MEILDLLNLNTKKKLISFLKQNSIKYESNAVLRAIYFPYSFYDLDFIVSISFVWSTATEFRLSLDNRKYTHAEKIEKMLELKNKFASILGNPKLDSSNHSDNKFLFASFETDSIKLSMNCEEFSDCGNVISEAWITISDPKNKADSNKIMQVQSGKILWCSSLIGGILFGLGSFIPMGSDYGYTLLNFLICMIGGLVWAVLFAVFMGLFNKKALFFGDIRDKTTIPTVVEKFGLQENEKCSGEVITFAAKNSRGEIVQRISPAVLTVKGSELAIYSIVKRENVTLITPLKEGYFNMLSNTSIEVKGIKTTYRFKTTYDDEYKAIEKTLADKLIDADAYNQLFKKFKDATVKYNPYQIYNSGDCEDLDIYISNVAKVFLLKPEMNKQEIQKLVLTVFGYDKYVAEPLSELYLEAFNENK